MQQSKEELKSLQSELLQKQVQWVYSRSPYYRLKFDEKGVKPSDIKGLEDITKLHLITRSELEQNFHDILCVPYSEVATVRLSSGTTGHPLKIAHTQEDIDNIRAASARRLQYHGVTDKDVIQITSAYGLSQGAWSMHWGAEQVGACVIPVGPADTERQILLIEQFGTTVLYGATNYHFRILEVAKALGADLSKNHLKIAFCVAENPTKTQTAILKKEFGYEKVISDYGATEFPGFSVNCASNPDVHHVWADNYIVEVVDPITHEPLPEGDRGELVLTSIQRKAFPLIRYLTHDVTTYLGFSKCACGMSHPKISSQIDREDFMTKIRGVTVFPSHIEVLLSKFPELTGKCQLIINKRKPNHEVTARIETNSNIPQTAEQALKKRVVEEVKNRVGVRINEVEFISSGVLPNKYKQVIVDE